MIYFRIKSVGINSIYGLASKGSYVIIYIPVGFQRTTEGKGFYRVGTGQLDGGQACVKILIRFYCPGILNFRINYIFNPYYYYKVILLIF